MSLNEFILAAVSANLACFILQYLGIAKRAPLSEVLPGIEWTGGDDDAYALEIICGGLES